MISIVKIRSFNGKLILHFVFVFFFFELLILKTKYKLSTYCIYLKALVVIIISKKSQLLRWSKLDNHLNKLSKFLLNGTNNEAQTENSCLKIVSITPFFLSKNLRSLCSPAIILFRTFFYDIAKALSNPWDQLIVWWIRIINLNWRLANCQRTVCADDHAHFFVRSEFFSGLIFTTA